MTAATDNLDRHQARLATNVTEAEAAARCGVPSVDELHDTLRLWGADPRRCSRSGRIELATVAAEDYDGPGPHTPEIVATGTF